MKFPVMKPEGSTPVQPTRQPEQLSRKVTGHGQHDRGSNLGRNFRIVLHVKTDSGAHLTSYLMSSEVPIPGVKVAGA
jgi:hypothetical protein